MVPLKAHDSNLDCLGIQRGNQGHRLHAGGGGTRRAKWRREGEGKDVAHDGLTAGKGRPSHGPAGPRGLGRAPRRQGRPRREGGWCYGGKKATTARREVPTGVWGGAHWARARCVR
ncbi:hypothetical protein KI387_041812, partial [Taxus chinensis]